MARSLDAFPTVAPVRDQITALERRLEDGYSRSREPGGEELRHHRQTSLGDAVIAPVFAYDLCIGGADSDNAAL